MIEGGTNAAIENRKAPARSPGGSKMMNAAVVTAWGRAAVKTVDQDVARSAERMRAVSSSRSRVASTTQAAAYRVIRMRYELATIVA